MPNTLEPEESCIVTGLDAIEQVALSQLVPSPRNPRRHSESNVAKIARSIVTYGWTTPVLITDAFEVIAGHGRLLADGCEIEPAYVDMAIRRWEAFTGRVARLAADNRSFQEVADARSGAINARPA